MEGVLYPLTDAFKYLQSGPQSFRLCGLVGGERRWFHAHMHTPLAQIQLCVLAYLPPLVQAGSQQAGLRTRGWGLLPYNTYLEQA